MRELNRSKRHYQNLQNLQVLIIGDAQAVLWIETPDSRPRRHYEILGKTNLADNIAWAPTNTVPNARFFKVQVELPK